MGSAEGSFEPGPAGSGAAVSGRAVSDHAGHKASGTLESIGTVLVANRGEIVVRICRTLRRLGIRSVAIYAPDDVAARHTRTADLAVAVDSYLDVDSVVAAAKASKADAVHPGYGFLSEDPGLARAVVGAGLLWIGPPPEAIEAMGDKIRAKESVALAGVPVVPGAGRPDMDDDELETAALEIGLPVLLKPAAGGGGKGMRRVAAEADLHAAIEASKREAQGAFGDGTLLVERWIERPRHIEVQVFADLHGNVVQLGERECSLQRRHQKIVEESPSPLLDDGSRSAMSQSAVDVARSCGYVGAGTVEFIVPGDEPDKYFFMEMNTRLQVEHPVTEAVTGIDLVEWQLRVAAGEPIPLSQDAVSRRGHAVEARVYAEDPMRGFLPAVGTVALLAEPTDLDGVRVDAALSCGTVVGTRYDPMLAKVIAWGPTRDAALERLRAALERTAILGVTTNVGYLTRLLAHPDVVAGRLDTGLVERTLDVLAPPRPDDTRDAAVAAACRVTAALEPRGETVDPWDVPDGWALAGPREWIVALRHDGHSVSVQVRGSLRTGAEMRVNDGPLLEVRSRALGPGGADDFREPGELGRAPSELSELSVTIDGTTSTWRTAVDGDDVWVARNGDVWRFVAERVARGERESEAVSAGPVTSPMPGVVAAVHVAVGDVVRAGQPLVAVEAMKMEHAVAAPADGVVMEVLVRPGQTVGLDEPLARVGRRIEEEGSAVDRDHGDGGVDDHVDRGVDSRVDSGVDSGVENDGAPG